MFKPKNVLVPATGALVLSFLVSIISTGNFGSSLFRAFLFFLLFAVLGFGISFLNDRFLSVGDDFTAGGGEESVPRRSSGNAVDIVIDDENLTDDGDSPRFNVEHNTRTLGERDTEAPSKASSVSQQVSESSAEMSRAPENSDVPQQENSGGAAAAGFVPVNLAEPAGSGSSQNVSGTSAAGVPDAAPVSSQPAQSSSGKVNSERAAQMKEIDDLPDLGSSEDGSDGEEGLIESSDFASLGESTEEEKVSVVDGEKAKDHDTETMAKAIRTLLKRE
ncbi:hypothetical protein DYE49_05070 [Treponema rectale]|uniref:Uncharacterized protein n=1 Tax=Treponema rectale TaxID=744512 RepID=A0A840SC87_9SPIR|nr:hypothetical protein [Treponema rectale]MBB5218454.1 hypothetical protein [Treponema rectale]QOS39856.1 hypothetical protein DYE49_05070 [Treponema rectale]